MIRRFLLVSLGMICLAQQQDAVSSRDVKGFRRIVSHVNSMAKSEKAAAIAQASAAGAVAQVRR